MIPGIASSAFQYVFTGGITYATAGTYSLVVPTGVTSLAGLAIGAGGGGGGKSAGALTGAAGGGGGALAYTNDIAVTPGETLTVVVGTGGTNGSSSGTAGSAGGSSRVLRGTTVLLEAAGGSGGLGQTGASSAMGAGGGAAVFSTGAVKYSGGTGGARSGSGGGTGGGSAAGYTSNGVKGGDSSAFPTAGSGGSGGGGGWGNLSANVGSGGNGGGTLFYGLGTSGAAGPSSGTSSARAGALGSTFGSSTTFGAAGVGSGPGGGGAGSYSSSTTSGISGYAGNDGAVRLLWGNAAFPSNGVKENTISLFASATSSAQTITVPAGVMPGDLLLLIDYAANGSSFAPSAATPSGFTQLRSITTSFGRCSVTYKQVQNQADANTTITGMLGGSRNSKFLLVIRGTRGYSSIYDTNYGFIVDSAAAPSNVTINHTFDPYAQGIPVYLCFFYGTSALTPNSSMTYTNGTWLQGATANSYLGFRIASQAMSSVSDTITMADMGTNTRCAFSLQGY